MLGVGWAGCREGEGLGEEGPDPRVPPRQIEGRSLTCLLCRGAWCCLSFLARDPTQGSWRMGAGGVPAHELGGSVRPAAPPLLDPHVFVRPLCSVSTFSTLMTSATTLLLNYLVAAAFFPLWSLDKNSQPHILLLGGGSGLADGATFPASGAALSKLLAASSVGLFAHFGSPSVGSHAAPLHQLL